MRERLKYALLGGCLLSAALTSAAVMGAGAQEATDPVNDPYADPRLVDSDDDAVVDPLDIYGFREAVADDEADADQGLTEIAQEQPAVSETPVFDGIPEGVDEPEPQQDVTASDSEIDIDTMQSEMLEALGEGPAPALPDEMEADSEFLEDQGVRLPTQSDPFGGEFSTSSPTTSDGTQMPDDGEGATDSDTADAPFITEDEFAGDSRERVMLSRSGARVRVLDKISGRADDIEIIVGETQSHRNLDLTVRACYQTPPEELPPESVAYVEVISNKINPETGTAAEDDPRLFGGWMFASSPGLNAMEHAIYDVWVINCMASEPVSE